MTRSQPHRSRTDADGGTRRCLARRACSAEAIGEARSGVFTTPRRHDAAGHQAARAAHFPEGDRGRALQQRRACSKLLGRADARRAARRAGASSHVAPVYVGDPIEVSRTISDIYDKKNGALTFIVVDTDYQRRGARWRAAGRRSWCCQRGDGMNAVAFPNELALRCGPISRHRPRPYAAASGDHEPLHLDTEVARAAGFERPIVHGMLTMACVAPALHAAFRRRLSVRSRRASPRFGCAATRSRSAAARRRRWRGPLRRCVRRRRAASSSRPARRRIARPALHASTPMKRLVDAIAPGVRVFVSTHEHRVGVAARELA